MTNLVKKVQNTIFQHKLFERGNKILLAVSGGPDSATMLHIFSSLQEKYDLELATAHINYGLRGKDSDGDEKFVRTLAEKYGLKIFVHNINVGAIHELPRDRAVHEPPLQKKYYSENYLRDIRYNFFEKIRTENNFDFIAVAHNLDDQVETFLMRIIRGSGLQGMASMKYKNGNIIRPLLSLSRDEIEKYLKENKLKYRIDKTNLQSKYLRNKIRNKLIPYLEKNFNPQIKKTIFSGVESVAEDYALISEMTDKTYSQMKELRVKDILSLSPALQKRVILEAIREKKPALKDIESAHVNEIMKIIGSTKSKRQAMVFKGLKVTRSGDRLKIEKDI
jgi:tRNA(Ile)-lysidine synthase